MSTIDTPRLGIVGLGNIGTMHAGLLRDGPATLVGGMDVDPDARAAFAEEFGVEAYETADALFDAVDAVIVTTPNRFHEEHVVAALEAGVDVLVEKPLADSLERAERIVAAERDADAFCMVGFHKRFADEVEVLAANREAGRFGTVEHVEADYIRRRGVPGRGSWFTRSDVAGGGALIDIGSHAIDLALYLLGYPDVEEVSGVTRSQFGTREDYAYVDMWGDDEGAGAFDVEDSATALLRCAGGRTVSLEVAWATNRPDSQEYFVRGDEGGARLDLGEGDLTFYETASDGVDHMLDTDVETPGGHPHTREQRAFIEAVETGDRPVRNTAEQALTVQRVIDAVYRSSEAGRAVRLDD